MVLVVLFINTLFRYFSVSNFIVLFLQYRCNVGVCVCKQDSPDLLLLLRMLSLGQGAWDMIDSQVFKEPRLVCIHKNVYKNIQHVGMCLEERSDVGPVSAA